MKKWIAALVVANIIIAFAWLQHARALRATEQAATLTRVDSDVSAWAIRPSDRGNEKIHWVRGYDEALRLASERKKLLLVLSTDGDICDGRI